MYQKTEGTHNSLLQCKSSADLSSLRQPLKDGHIGRSYNAIIKRIFQREFPREKFPESVPAQTCISGSPLIIVDKKDSTNDSPSHEHLVSNNLAGVVTSADRLNIVKLLESVSGCVFVPSVSKNNKSSFHSVRIDADSLPATFRYFYIFLWRVYPWKGGKAVQVLHEAEHLQTDGRHDYKQTCCEHHQAAQLLPWTKDLVNKILQRRRDLDQTYNSQHLQERQTITSKLRLKPFMFIIQTCYRNGK